MIIIVGSTSAIKEQAFRIAFEGIASGIRTFDAASGVDEQPCGFETHRGARNRCMSAQMGLPLPGAAYMAIENGIKSHGGDTVDFAVFHAVMPDGFELSVTGPQVVVPSDIYDEWEQRSYRDNTLTWGDVYSGRRGCDRKDPHKHLTGTPRLQYLVETIRPVLPVILAHDPDRR